MNLGILGFGGMGYWHAHNAVKTPGVRIAGSYDINPHAYDDSPEIHVYPSEEAFLNAPEIDTVLLTVPNHLHKQYAIKAAKAGKNVLCEKPAALSIADFDEMVRTAKECGVLFTVHQNRRWDKDFAIVKKAYNEGLIGEIFDIQSTLHSANGKLCNWHQFKAMGGGMIWDWGIHLIDQALQLIPHKIVSVFAGVKNALNAEADDFFRIVLTFENGRTFTISQSTYCLKPSPRWLVCGDKGTIVINSFACDGNLYTTSELITKLPPRIVENPAGPTRSFLPVPPGKLLVKPLPEVHTDWSEFYQNYIDVMAGKAEFVVRPEQVRRVLAVVDAAFRSGETKQSVSFTYDQESEIVFS
jgi:scyllo-inositol 2-dehydrogenase (NADP+)